MNPIEHLIPLKTPAVARELGISYQTLRNLLRRDQINPHPQRDSSLDFIWFPEDIERARVAVATRRKAGRPKTSKPSTNNQ
jgi:hypothetical protein